MRSILAAGILSIAIVSSLLVLPSYGYDIGDRIRDQANRDRLENERLRTSKPNASPAGWGTRSRANQRKNEEEMKKWHKESQKRLEEHTKKWRAKLRKERGTDEKERRQALEENRQASIKARAAQTAAMRKKQADFIKAEHKMMQTVNKLRKAGKYDMMMVQLKRMDQYGHPYGAYLLGKMYTDGDHVKKDKSKAFTWFKKAAHGGSGEGAYALADAYIKGEGIKKDMNEAIGWLEVSTLPAAKGLLGAMYLEGVEVPKDYKKARENLKQSNIPAARASLGEICLLGLGMPAKPLEAKRWLELAANSNNPKAYFYLSKMYADGNGFSKDEARAKEYKKLYRDCLARMKPSVSFKQKVLFKGVDDMESRLVVLSKDSTPKAKPVIVNATPSPPVQKNNVSPKGAVARAVPKTPPSKTKAEIYQEVKALVKKFYPKAKIATTDKTVHFEFKTRPAKGIGRRIITIPKLDGIVGDIKLKEGKYGGDDVLPSQSNGTLYVSLKMAPYSAKDDSHLYTRLKFPPNASLDFVRQFKALLGRYSTPGDELASK